MFKNKLSLMLAAASAASLAHAAPFLAIGNNAELFLTGVATAKYDDNVFLASSNKEDDISFIVTPGALLRFGKESLFKGSFSIAENLVSYVDFDNLNDQLLSLSYDGSIDTAKWVLRSSASYVESNQNTRDAFASDTLVNRANYAAALTGEYRVSPKYSIASGLTYYRTDYSTAGFTDNKYYTVPTSVYYELTPKVDVSVGMTYKKDKVEGADNRQSYFYNVGARGEFTPKLSGELKVGITKLIGDDVDNKTTWGLQTGLDYQLTPKTLLRLDASNDFSTSSQGESQENMSIALGAKSTLTVDLNVYANVQYRKIDYAGSRKDDYVVAYVGAGYMLNSMMSVSGGYTFQDNSSNANGADFTGNTLQVSFSITY